MTTTLDKVLERKPMKRDNARPTDSVDEVRAEPVVEVSGKVSASPEAIARRNRRTKTPISGRRNILTVKGLAPGMVGRWVDNDPDRVAQLMEQGYEPVRQPVQVGDISIESGQQLGAVTTKRTGGGKESILMQIPKEWYEADQKQKQRLVDTKEAALHEKGKDGVYYGGMTHTDIVPGKFPTVREEGKEG